MLAGHVLGRPREPAQDVICPLLTRRARLKVHRLLACLIGLICWAARICAQVVVTVPRLSDVAAWLRDVDTVS